MGRPGMSGAPAWTDLTPEQYADAFPGLFTRSAFRLEQLDHYLNPVEEEPFQRHLRGLSDDLAWRRPWLDLVAEATAAGKTMTRVHVVTEPWTDYTEFELTVAYPPAVRAGEDIRIIPRGGPFVGHDFWLTEEPMTVARMIYMPDGDWTGVELTDHPDVVAQYVTWRAEAIAASIPLASYLDSVRRRTA